MHADKTPQCCRMRCCPMRFHPIQCMPNAMMAQRTPNATMPNAMHAHANAGAADIAHDAAWQARLLHQPLQGDAPHLALLQGRRRRRRRREALVARIGDGGGRTGGGGGGGGGARGGGAGRVGRPAAGAARHLRLREPRGEHARPAVHQLRQRDSAEPVQRADLRPREAPLRNNCRVVELDPSTTAADQTSTVRSPAAQSAADAFAHPRTPEQEEEEIDITDVVFKDNSGVIELIAGKPRGIFALLEEQVLLPPLPTSLHGSLQVILPLPCMCSCPPPPTFCRCTGEARRARDERDVQGDALLIAPRPAGRRRVEELRQAALRHRPLHRQPLRRRHQLRPAGLPVKERRRAADGPAGAAVVARDGADRDDAARAAGTRGGAGGAAPRLRQGHGLADGQVPGAGASAPPSLWVLLPPFPPAGAYAPFPSHPLSVGR